MATSVQIERDLDGVSGVTRFVSLAPQQGVRVALVGGMHGNEPVGVATLRRFEEAVREHLTAGEVLAIVANEEAVAMGLRHTPSGMDLNRLWDPESLQRIRNMPEEARCYEQSRALALAGLVSSCDVILDLHSTSRPTAPHLVMRDDQKHALMASKLGISHVVTGLHENGILSGGLCANVGLRFGESGAHMGFVLEAGQHDDPDNMPRAWEVVRRLLHALGMWDEALPLVPKRPEVYEVIDRVRQAPEGTLPYRFVGYEGGEPGEGRRSAPPRLLHSFERVEADEVVLRRGASEVVRARSPFTMLMPAPHTAPGTDLYYVTQRRFGGLSGGAGRTSEEARAEAVAIERMMDLLADDDMDAGTIWAGFDSSRLLDLCAQTIGRIMRLPEHHPHRRLTIVSQGNVPHDDQEQRASRRYRHALEQALREGLPIERFQLLRGASLDWLRSLTGSRMQNALTHRAQQAPDAPPMKLWLSTRQPQSVSMLIAGDLERALSQGDARWVRVIVVIEAMTVEPDLSNVRRRVHRMGLVANRHSLISAAAGWCQRLRVEHTKLMSDPAFQALDDMCDPCEERTLAMPTDRQMLDELRGTLVRHQLSRWATTLQDLGLGTDRIPEPDVGGWLAEVANASGILDIAGLRALLLRPSGDGSMQVAPESLAKAAASPETVEVSVVRPARDPVVESPPVLSREVDCDNLERWVGWMRFVRGVERVPGQRGRDLDIYVGNDDVLAQIADAFHDVVRRSSQTPGDLLVVVAGDGFRPESSYSQQASSLMDAHQALVGAPGVHYLRVQHAPSVHMGWMKGVLDAAGRRPRGNGSVQVHWEEQHGRSVNVILVAARTQCGLSPDEPGYVRPVSLDGWTIERCFVMLATENGIANRGGQVAVATDHRAGAVNAELLHFARSHCQGLLNQVAASQAEGTSSLARVHGVLERWVTRARKGWSKRSPGTRDDDRATWMHEHLGLDDAELVEALCSQLDTSMPPDAAAQQIWHRITPWHAPHAGS